ncbi:nucleotidyltransferase domain-containing protein, partial [candidate division KSB1 bacterium]|nr:nucleotidyltransferase domain-containing protein [candidate division KSB1 bacterium]
SEQAVEILLNIDYSFGLELVVRSPEELDRRIKLGDYFLMDAVEEGKVLYESDS